MGSRGDRHLRAVRQARELAQLGARLKTIQAVTGLPPRQAQALFFPDGHAIPRGRAPESVEWFHSANLIVRIDACLFGVKYRQLRLLELDAAEALLCAYRAYLAVIHPPRRISLDRAFTLAAHLDGIWLTQATALTISSCPRCGCAHLTALGTPAVTDNHCPFCRLLARFPLDPRLHIAYRSRRVPALDSLLLDSVGLAERHLGPWLRPQVLDAA